MLTGRDFTIMENRKLMAQMALSEVKSVRSTNKPDSNYQNISDMDVLTYCRERNTQTIARIYANTMRTHVGNCEEKSVICYTFLSRYRTIVDNASVIICKARGWNHGIVLVTHKMSYFEEYQIQDNKISSFPETTLIVDGWSDDWYFPNLDPVIAKSHDLANAPTPWQDNIRQRCENDLFCKWVIPLQAAHPEDEDPL